MQFLHPFISLAVSKNKQYKNKLVLLRYVKYCFWSINDTINQNYRNSTKTNQQLNYANPQLGLSSSHCISQRTDVIHFTQSKIIHSDKHIQVVRNIIQFSKPTPSSFSDSHPTLVLTELIIQLQLPCFNSIFHTSVNKLVLIGSRGLAE